MADTDTRDPEAVVAAQRAVQEEVRSDDRAKKKGGSGAAQLGARDYPAPPFPEQHQPKPGSSLASAPGLGWCCSGKGGAG